MEGRSRDIKEELVARTQKVVSASSPGTLGHLTVGLMDREPEKDQDF